MTLLTAVFGPSAMAAGFSIFEQGAKATGMGGAFAATADDPSAMFYNVAGIAYQREASVLVGGTAITFKNEFSGEDYEFPGPGATGRYEEHTFLPVNGYIILPIGKNMTFGVGSFTAFGLRTDWENNNQFDGRFIAQDTELKTASVQPSFAWKNPSGTFAIGVGGEYRVSRVKLKRNLSAINPFTQEIADIGHTYLKSDDLQENTDWGFSVGAIYRPSDRWSFGLSYRDAMEIDYNGTATFTQIETGYPEFDGIVSTLLPPDQAIRTSVAFPAIIQAGVATAITPTWTLALDVVHMTWSDYKTLVVDFEDPGTPDLIETANWDDVFSYRIGANKQVNDRWSVQMGLLWDESPQPVEDAGPILPDSDRLGVSFGLGFNNGKWRVDLSDLYLPFSDRDTLGVNEDNFNGKYKTTANLFSFNVGYTF
jgi:long-chain fatty acid transport protein